jgi:hypothetical protein
MPRGGRRPGAGAPKGNFNAVRSGLRSRRMVMVYMALLEILEKRDATRKLALVMYEAGFFPPPSHKFNNDLRGAVWFLYKRWFDSPQDGQSNTIKDNQILARTALASDLDLAPEAPGGGL